MLGSPGQYPPRNKLACFESDRFEQRENLSTKLAGFRSAPITRDWKRLKSQQRHTSPKALVLQVFPWRAERALGFCLPGRRLTYAAITGKAQVLEVEALSRTPRALFNFGHRRHLLPCD